MLLCSGPLAVLLWEFESLSTAGGSQLFVLVYVFLIAEMGLSSCGSVKLADQSSFHEKAVLE